MHSTRCGLLLPLQHVLCICQYLLVTTVSPTKMAKPIEIPFSMWTWVSPTNYVISGDQIPQLGYFGGRSQVCPYHTCPWSIFSIFVCWGVAMMLRNLFIYDNQQQVLFTDPMQQDYRVGILHGRMHLIKCLVIVLPSKACQQPDSPSLQPDAPTRTTSTHVMFYMQPQSMALNYI